MVIDASTLKARLETATISFNNLELQLADPDVASNPKRLESIARERSRLEPLVVDYEALKNVECELDQIRDYFKDIQIITDDYEKYSLFKKADFACAASGTVTLELGLTETPTIVIYKMDKLTWFFISKMVKVKFVSLVNLILGRESSKELLQVIRYLSLR